MKEYFTASIASVPNADTQIDATYHTVYMHHYDEDMTEKSH